MTYTMDDARRGTLNMAGSFSGCGGSSIGYGLGGFKTRWACEFDGHAADCYELNFPDTKVDRRSIADVTGADILEFFPDGVDLWEGSPPCSKFSMVGKREKGWNKVSQSDQSKQKLQNVEDLVFEWTRLLGEIRPRAAVAENVTAMLKGAAKGFAVEALAQIRAHGYEAKIWTLNATSFEAPQIRRRIFFVCWDPARCAEPVMPVPSGRIVSASEAISGLRTVPVLKTMSKITDWNEAPLVPESTPNYQRLLGLKPGQHHTARFSLGKAHPDRPSSTLASMDLQSRTLPGAHHWDNPPRKWSAHELMALSSFPTDYQWPPQTTLATIGTRLGNIVPPLLAKAVAQSMHTALQKG